MEDYFFPFDKNYITKEAQFSIREKLLTKMVIIVREEYFARHNPLGLEDRIIKTIKGCTEFNTTPFIPFYENLAGIYRYRFGSNQLSIIFDGKSQFEKAEEDWEKGFTHWVRNFSNYYPFLKTVLEVAILIPALQEHHGQVSYYYKPFIARLNSLLPFYLGVKIDRRRKFPIMEMAEG